ncbi:hypothetical protein [Cellulosilyticum sp. I15G10I2]|uniref:hypothetical protein n=1 Tax=Cellulosilyticum sp. I15G10I2 TaxID=1892843 RepID=UPI00085C139E|nr:hypothetical protein [Cellulosilyticum sp. I15G10I2]
MKAKFVGIQDLNFQNDKGETITGKNLFIVYEDENVTGLKAGKLFLKEGTTLPKDVKLNDTLELSFNMKGKVEAIFKA